MFSRISSMLDGSAWSVIARALYPAAVAREITSAGIRPPSLNVECMCRSIMPPLLPPPLPAAFLRQYIHRGMGCNPYSMPVGFFVRGIDRGKGDGILDLHEKRFGFHET